MARTAITDGGRTESKRFADDVSLADAIEGDRIDTQLVARHHDHLGAPIQPAHPQADYENPDTQLVRVTDIDGMDDVHSAILFDPDTETFARASRHDSQQAWTQKEADWKVRDVGSEVVVDEVHELERPKEKWDEPASEYAEEWVEIIFDDIRYTGGDPEFRDERRLDGTALELRDGEGRKLLASISLEGGQ